MAELTIHVPVFIASPTDVLAEREKATKVIEKIKKEFTYKGVLLSVYRWEIDAIPSAQPPQSQIDQYLKKAELIIVIFGNNAGSEISVDSGETGTLHELRIATDRVKIGAADDVFLYFKHYDDDNGIDPKIVDLKNQIHKVNNIFYSKFDDPSEQGGKFEEKFENHIRNWVYKWLNIYTISRFTLERSGTGFGSNEYLGENKFVKLKRNFNIEPDDETSIVLGKNAVSLYQRYGGRGIGYPLSIEGSYTNLENYLTQNSFFINQAFNIIKTISSDSNLFDSEISDKPLAKKKNGGYFFSHPEWFCCYCAIGLRDAILNNNISAVSSFEYINPIHQYLGVLIKKEKQNIQKYEDTLIGWLTTDSQEPIARNFAAFVLGMVESRKAEDYLAEAAKGDRGQNVGIYSIMSLGKLRSRRFLDLIVEQALNEIDLNKKLYMGQCICNIIGIAEYPV